MGICFSSADIMLPVCDMEKWAVIACDQYTSEPEYWQNVKETVGENPSALNLVLPEVYLSDDNQEKIDNINNNMLSYEKSGLFKTYKDAMVFVRRTQSDGKQRLGIIGKIDLDEYDYLENSTAQVRATEKTVISRIPPRVEIRKGASLELPHVMLLIDDSEFSVIEEAAKHQEKFQNLYDFDLMCGGGHIKGDLMDKDTQNKILSALEKLYTKNGGFLFSVGDGNHSLAAAKECYNQNKTEKSRYALVEIVNIHSPALEFEPIYRTVKTENGDKIISDFVSFCGGEYKGADAQKFTCIYKAQETEISVKPKFKLPVGTLQSFLDGYAEPLDIDYIHNISSIKKLCREDGTLGFLFEGMKKQELFSSVAADGSLPRKTFSMGHADDKRFYLECRKIK